MKSTTQNNPSSICAIIPAFNEADRIGRVLKTVVSSNCFDQIIVSDDASGDETVKVASLVDGRTQILRSEKNQGKTSAVLRALKQCQSNYVFLFDADLEGLSTGDITSAVERLNDGFDMIIVNYGKQEWWLRWIFRSFPALSGMRVVRIELLKNLTFTSRDRFALETRINDQALRDNWCVGIFMKNQITTPHKYQKYGGIKGLYLEVEAVIDIILSNGWLAMPKLFYSWATLVRKSKVLSEKSID